MSIKTRWFILQMNDSKLLTWMYLVLHIFVHMAYIIVISYQDYHTHIRIFYYIDYEWKQLTVKWQSWWWYSHFFFVWFSITFSFSINIMLIRTITQLLYFFNCNWIFFTGLWDITLFITFKRNLVICTNTYFIPDRKKFVNHTNVK